MLISNWELGETGPTPNQLKQLIEIFHVSANQLLEHFVDEILIEKSELKKSLFMICLKSLLLKI